MTSFSVSFRTIILTLILITVVGYIFVNTTIIHLRINDIVEENNEKQAKENELLQSFENFLTGYYQFSVDSISLNLDKEIDKVLDIPSNPQDKKITPPTQPINNKTAGMGGLFVKNKSKKLTKSSKKGR